MLDVVVTGGCWFKDRRHSAFPQEVTTPLCPRCEMEPQTEAHAYWTCICLNRSDIQEVKDTQHLVEEAKRGLGMDRFKQSPAECLWLRGIMPRDLVEVQEPATQEDILLKGEIPPEGIHGIVCGDGSG